MSNLHSRHLERMPTGSAEEAQRTVERRKRSVTVYPEVDAFAEFMRQELERNEWKGDRETRRDLTPYELLMEIFWHATKLSVAMRDEDLDRIIEHTADVANQAMMVADVFNLLPRKVETP
jgi:hypothetical protein